MSRSADRTGCRVDMPVVMTANRRMQWPRDLFLEIDTFAAPSEIGSGVAEGAAVAPISRDRAGPRTVAGRSTEVLVGPTKGIVNASVQVV